MGQKAQAWMGFFGFIKPNFKLFDLKIPKKYSYNLN